VGGRRRPAPRTAAQRARCVRRAAQRHSRRLSSTQTPAAEGSHVHRLPEEHVRKPGLLASAAAVKKPCANDKSGPKAALFSERAADRRPRILVYFRCLLTSEVISNMLTCAFPNT